tara:strand:+ start:3727 stop:4806 length:1080 start_codon:yes stop_codon:yes gene_type:complete
MIIFTRYLYNLDEVKLTFLDCLLKQRNLNECYYWLYEFYKSGYEKKTWELLWKIYCDFYLLKNPKMEEKIKEKYSIWKKKNSFNTIMWVVKNLFRQNSCHTVFMLRVYYCNRNTDILTGNMINLNGINFKTENEIMLIKAIKEKKKIAVCYHLKRIKDIDRRLLLVNTYFDTNIEYIENSNKYLYLLAKITQKLKITPKKKVYYKIVSGREVKEILKSDESCRNEGKHNDVSYVYKTLKSKRLYRVSKDIGCFKLDREGLDLNHLYWYHWEFYAYKTPLWKSRFDKYKVRIIENKQTIKFDDEDEYEEFYEEYGYEPDEQSKEVQEKSICNIEKSNIKSWINSIFKKKLTKNVRVKIEY